MKNIKQKSGLCDLHTHSTFSDGTLTPEEIVREAARIGLDAVALTDHNTTGGAEEFLRAAEKYGIFGIPGCEISVDSEHGELHLVALFLDREARPALSEYLSEFVEYKKQSNRDMVNALCERGYEVSYDELAAKVRGGVFNRAHVAMLLAERGYVGSKDEAFDTLLKKGGGIYKEPKRLSVYDAVRFVKRIGGTAVLAHPGLTLDEAALCDILPRLCDAGLDAIETYYTTYDEKTQMLCRKIASEHHLLESGGSDFHGERKADTALGKGYGSLTVKTDIIEPLMARSSFLKGYNDMKNELLFLGTSACEFSPRLETDLKDKFDKDARRSSAAIYGGRYLLDCGIHTPESLGIAGCELGKITDIFITHLHRDHYIEANIEKVAEGAGGVRLWVREDAKEISIPGVTVMRMKPFVTYEVDEATTVTGLPANHDPRFAPQHILLTVNGKKIYYGTDGAWMLHDSFKHLTNAALDACILDCTSGDYNGDFRMGEHNSIPMIRLMLPSLCTIGAITDNTRLFVTHMAPSLHVSHAETEKIMEPLGVTVAYDGLCIEI